MPFGNPCYLSRDNLHQRLQSVHELIDLADRWNRVVSEYNEAPFQSDIEKLGNAAKAIAASWSGSNIGYHSNVYYLNFQSPPAGPHFSSDWGLRESLGDWREFKFGDVKRLIFENAGNPDLTVATKQSDTIKVLCDKAKHEIISHVTLALENRPDFYLKSLLEKSNKILFLSTREFECLVFPSQVSSCDATAMSQGLVVAPHQNILALVLALASPAEALKELAEIARKAGSHLARAEKNARRDKLVGTNVFIGHGRAFAWRDLKDFISDRLKLPYDEFNRVPVAGITNIARLSEMLESAAVAFVILTAEDEQADGVMHARLNVIHEVGLFQGRLGFTKAIVLLEDGCEQFSNIEGLGQIRFSKGKISAVFEEIRRVLEREGLIE